MKRTITKRNVLGTTGVALCALSLVTGAAAERPARQLLAGAQAATVGGGGPYFRMVPVPPQGVDAAPYPAGTIIDSAVGLISFPGTGPQRIWFEVRFGGWGQSAADTLGAYQFSTVDFLNSTGGLLQPAFEPCPPADDDYCRRQFGDGDTGGTGCNPSDNECKEAFPQYVGGMPRPDFLNLGIYACDTRLDLLRCGSAVFPDPVACATDDGSERYAATLVLETTQDVGGFVNFLVSFDLDPSSTFFHNCDGNMLPSTATEAIIIFRAGQCQSDAECDDGDPCTSDACNLGTASCEHEPIPNCPPECTSDADCDDGDSCTDDSCDLNAGACVNAPIPNCPAGPTPTLITYQGFLEKPPGSPLTDTCDFRFGLWGDDVGGILVPVTPPATNPAPSLDVPVVSGAFSTEMDFGPGAFNGDPRWLEIEVQCPGDAGFVLLSPRKPVTPAPYALRALEGIGPANALRVSEAGDVGIGTADPLARLHVNGGILASGVIRSGKGVEIDGPNHGINSSEAIDIRVADNVVMRMETTGVSIGSEGAAAQLDVAEETATASVGLPAALAVGQPLVDGTAVRGVANFGASARGVEGLSAQGTGVLGISASPFLGTSGVRGIHTAASGIPIVAPTGVWGDTSVGNGVVGVTTALGGTVGVGGIHTSASGIYPAIPAGVGGESNVGIGIIGASSALDGVRGISGAAAGSAGVRGISGPASGITHVVPIGVWGDTSVGDGVVGFTTAPGGRVGIGGIHTSATGIYPAIPAGVGGESNAGIGIIGVSTAMDGIRGISSTPAGSAGVRGISGAASGLTPIAPAGVWGDTSVGDGVVGTASADNAAGVLGKSDNPAGIGVKGIGENGALAGSFDGDVNVQGNIRASGTITSGSSITIDGSAGSEKITSTADLELHVSDGRALRIETNATSPNLIGGFSGNTVEPGVVGATIGGGGESDDGLGNPSEHRVTDDYGTIGGGRNNQAGDAAGTTMDRSFATVGGGSNNTASGFVSTVGGGRSNIVSADYGSIAGGGESTPGDPATGNRVFDRYGTVGGGGSNRAGSDDADPLTATFVTVAGGLSNTASGQAATVGGGESNLAGRACIGGVNDGQPCTNDAECPDGVCSLGNRSTVGGGFINKATGQQSTVGGGVDNKAKGDQSAVGGGLSNTASGQAATVGGGESNLAGRACIGGVNDGQPCTNDTECPDGVCSLGDRSTVGGGGANTASGLGATVAGGRQNTASAQDGTVCGGFDNEARGADSSTVCGGAFNIAGGTRSTIGGGGSNTTGGFASTVPGGESNQAGGNYSFAAGRRAKVRTAAEVGGGDTDGDEGTFVWADSTNADFVSDGPNRFLVRASAGTNIYSNAAVSVGVQLAAGGNAWSAISDRNLKENVKRVDPRDVLERLTVIPVSEWNLKSQDPSIRHLGPMAQDFRAAFGLGESDTHISTSDADGVALAAIQGLYEIVQEKDCEDNQRDQEKDRRVEELEQQNMELEARLARLEALLSTTLTKGEK